MIQGKTKSQGEIALVDINHTDLENLKFDGHLMFN